MVESMNKPDFLIIGAAKAATTTLSSMLDQHPQAGIVAGKEPHFFSIDQVYANGWDWYINEYSRCRGKTVLGDASTSYSRIRYYPDTLARIVHHIPDVKIIYMVRHPLQRIESAYIERLASVDSSHGYASINEAVRAQPMMVDSGRYWEVFDHYRQRIPEEHIRIVWFEEFVSEIETEFRNICEFLGIDWRLEQDQARVQQNTRSQVMDRLARNPANEILQPDMRWDPGTRKRVLGSLRDDNLRFLDYFNKPADYWAGIFD